MSGHAYTLTEANVIDHPWRSLQSVNVGQGASWRGADGYLLVERDNLPWLRLDVRHHERSAPFAAAIHWRDWLVVGFDAEVYFVGVEDLSVHTTFVDSYFGYLYPSPEFLLIASCTELIRIEPDLRESWRCEGLAVDGVLVDTMDDSVIEGEFCWDPMETWKRFRLDSVTGQHVDVAQDKKGSLLARLFAGLRKSR